MITGFTIVVSIGAYMLSRWLYLRFNHPLINVVLLSTILIISILTLCEIPYEAYIPGKEIMTFLLGPATVALAVPLYRQRALLKQYGTAILWGVGLGTFISMGTAILIAYFGGLSKVVIISIAPKSATIPFAVEVARMAGGDPALAAAFVVATGTFGSVLGLSILNWFGITHPIARGLAMGTVAHGQGTAMALMEGERPGAMAGVAMALAGIFTSVLAPVFIAFVLK